MDVKTIILTTFTILFVVIGAIAPGIIALPNYLYIFPENVSPVAVIITIFAFGFMFFGYSSPLIAFFAGVHFEQMYPIETAIIPLIISIIVTSMALFASINLGTTLLQDMVEKGNFRKSLGISLIVLAIIVIISIVMQYVF